MKQKPFFSGTQPCNSCPYRKDAPLGLWDKSEFDKLLEEDKKQFGATYRCHKNDGSCCKGWLINQDKRNQPNINLRLMLLKSGVKRDYLDKLKSNTEMFETIEEMVKTNYPNDKSERNQKRRYFK